MYKLILKKQTYIIWTGQNPVKVILIYLHLLKKKKKKKKKKKDNNE